MKEAETLRRQGPGAGCARARVDDAAALLQMLNPTVFLQRLEESKLVAADALAAIREFVGRYERGELQVEFLLAAFIASGAA